jgi:hypothetical protein
MALDTAQQLRIVDQLVQVQAEVIYHHGMVGFAQHGRGAVVIALGDDGMVAAAEQYRPRAELERLGMDAAGLNQVESYDPATTVLLWAVFPQQALVVQLGHPGQVYGPPTRANEADWLRYAATLAAEQQAKGERGCMMLFLNEPIDGCLAWGAELRPADAPSVMAERVQGYDPSAMALVIVFNPDAQVIELVEVAFATMQETKRTRVEVPFARPNG